MLLGLNLNFTFFSILKFHDFWNPNPTSLKLHICINFLRERKFLKLSCIENNSIAFGVLKNIPIKQHQNPLRTAGARLEVTSLLCELSVLIFFSLAKTPVCW